MPRLAEATHAEQPWRVHELTGDFAGSRARNFPTTLAATPIAG